MFNLLEKAQLPGGVPDSGDGEFQVSVFVLSFLMSQVPFLLTPFSMKHFLRKTFTASPPTVNSISFPSFGSDVTLFI